MDEGDIKLDPSLSLDEKKDFLDPLGLSSDKAAVLAFGLMDSMIHHYHFFAIKTIDSFINALLAGCAFKINLSGLMRERFFK